MPLHTPTVDAIFAKLSLAYGHRFLSIWDGFPIDAVKADWGRELACFATEDGAMHHAIVYGLEHLPAARPPDVFEFRAICRRRPDLPGQVKLPDMGKRVVPEVVRAQLAELTTELAGKGPKRLEWARRFVEKFGGEGVALRHTQRHDLALARQILAFEQADKETAARKAEAQRKTDEYLEQGHGQTHP